MSLFSEFSRGWGEGCKAMVDGQKATSEKRRFEKKKSKSDRKKAKADKKKAKAELQVQLVKLHYLRLQHELELRAGRLDAETQELRAKRELAEEQLKYALKMKRVAAGWQLIATP